MDLQAMLEDRGATGPSADTAVQSKLYIYDQDNFGAWRQTLLQHCQNSFWNKKFIAYIQAQVFSVAEQLIQSWINDVRLASTTPEVTPTSGDFLSSVDWVDGDVGQSAKDIVQGLLSKNLDVKTVQQRSQKCHEDPTVSMEMRHKKVSA